ncbi:MAG: tRNA (adenine-N1)-methyltransferase [Candidatus Altiarchaeales archaeon]|nr:tRNA (adenine-N1)-methyltransferase [Candidatus Altiarchaeales archaeon]MBD3417144.1 tRNA (adenine-N1)-methyltransferase [Candidatus Altiarchaeales archaeon]
MKLLIDEKGRKYLLGEGKDLHCNYGMIRAKDIEKAGVGGLVESNKGRKFNVLEPDILDFISKAKRGPQAMTLKDMGLISGYAGLESGSRVLEAGTGSGLLTMYLAHIVRPADVITYEVREDHARVARENFERFGIGNVDSRIGDLYDGIGEEGLDAVLLDLTEPWRVVPHLEGSLRVGGRLVSYSPSINQSRQLADVLEGYMHETFECILRHWKADTMRPDTRMLGHTGFLTVARKLK